VQEIMLVNLMRMGDILQTTPLIESLRDAHPGARISMVLSDSFVEVGRRVGLDEIHPFPVKALRGLVSRPEGFPEGWRILSEFLQRVHAGRSSYDWVFNLTPSAAAASLSSLIRHRAHQGMWLEEDGSIQTPGPWTAYLVAAISHRRTNPFHLVDIWRRAFGLAGPRGLSMQVMPEDTAEAQRLLAEHGLNPDRDLLIGLQPSASQKEKCWSEREFVRLGQTLHRDLGARILLFGVDAEADLCARIGAGIPEAVSLAGQTGLGTLAATLKRCRLLVSNDTGTLHIATAVGTPVIVVSVGPVFFRETGPYGEGHWVLQPRLACLPCPFDVSCLKPVCKEMIRAEHVFRVAVAVLRGGGAPESEMPPDVSCYRSGFDASGLLSFTSGRPDPGDGRIDLYKGLWLSLLEGRPLPAAAADSGCLDPETAAGWARLVPLVERASRILRQIQQAGERGEADASRWKVLSENHRSVEEQMRQVALEVADLAPFVHFVTLRREALSFQDPMGFLRDAAALYDRVAAQAGRAIPAGSLR